MTRRDDHRDSTIASERTGKRSRSRRGTVLMLVSVSMVGVMGVMALAVDVGSLQRQRRVAQAAADAGALSGASEIMRGRYDLIVSSARAESTRNGFTNGVDAVGVAVNYAPTSGYYAGNPMYVEVIVSRTVPTYFARLVGANAVNVRARSVAGVGAPGESCIYALERSAEKALNVSSLSDLDSNCGVIVNSSNAKAIVIESAGDLEAGSITVTGGIDAAGGTVTSGSTVTGVPPSANPLGYLQVPYFNPTQCDYTNMKVDSYGQVTQLYAGIYCGGIEITSNGSAFLNPGTYILRGGGLKMGGGVISGVGITIVNTNANPANGGAEQFKKIEMGSASQANLSAPTTGPLAGILFFQDPNAGKAGDLYENVIGSGSNAVFNGTLYFPTQPIEVGASASTTTVTGGIVATKVTVTSNSDVNVSGLGGTNTPFKRLSLVE